MRYLYVKAGKVVNIVEYSGTAPLVGDDAEDIIPDPGGVSVGASYDVTPDLNERHYNTVDQAVLKELFRLTNEVRTLQAKGTLTPAQYKVQLKALM